MNSASERDAQIVAESRGPLAWMAKNGVAANLLMFVVIVGGLVFLTNLKQEVFPEFELDLVLVNVPYPGASPSEVEQGVVLAVEEAVRGLDGVKEVRSTTAEGVATVAVELLLGADKDRALADVKSAVDRITSLPQDAERPVVSLASNRRGVISLVIYGDLDTYALRGLAEQARDELLEDPNITYAELAAISPPEISIEVPHDNLRRYNLTLEEVANRIGRASVELPGGGMKTPGGEVLVRTTERRDVGEEFGEVVVLSRPDGTQVRVRDIAAVQDGFQDDDQEAYFNGQRAALVKVYRVGNETPISVAQAVKDYIVRAQPKLPPGVQLATWNDAADVYAQRVDLLRRNGTVGLVLVLLTLGLFLQPRLAFWVTLGIPISFIGSFLFLPAWDVSLNMISLFAFIVTLGIVVDDAIVVGEAIYKRREDGLAPMAAAIAGVQEVAVPVIFSVMTTVVAFFPLLLVPGVSGKFFMNIPTVVIAVLALSLIESLLILPAHLGHASGFVHTALGYALGWLRRPQQRFGRGLKEFIELRYGPLVRRAVAHRYVTVAASVAILLTAIGLVVGGRVQTGFLPKIDSDRVTANLSMPFGAAADQTRAAMNRVLQAGQSVAADNGGDEILRGVFSQIGGQSAGFGAAGASAPRGGHLAQVSVYLVASDGRDITAREFARQWRERVGPIPGIDTLAFNFSTGPGASSAISMDLSHPRLDVLEQGSAELAAALGEFNGVEDINDGFEPGKEQIDLTLRPNARSLGVNETELARQLRGAFFGIEAVRQQRGRDEVRTYVRLPEAERASEYALERLLIRTRDGGEVPLAQAAELNRGRAYTTIRRLDGRRYVSVTADVVPGVANANSVVAAVAKNTLPDILSRYPGLQYSPGGNQKSQAETNAALGQGFMVSMFVIFALLAVVFRSYVQPVIIMLAIPFGVVGAIIGHLFMGFDLNFISAMGVVALSGIVVNDSLILIVATNQFRAQGMSARDAVVAGAMRRFRPILLTSLTTFFGLMPMILEPSVQARFLIPMAISLGFGVLFATGIILLLVPAVYTIVEDVRRLAVGHEGLEAHYDAHYGEAEETPKSVAAVKGAEA